MKYAISGLAILLFFISCAGDSNRDLIISKSTLNSLDQSSKTINEITTDYRKQLFERLNDVSTAEQAAVWQPKAAKVSELASSTTGYIYKLKNQLREAVGNSISGEASVFESDNYNAVNEIFFQQKNGEELHRQLRRFIDSVNTVDPWLKNRYAAFVSDKFDYLDSAKYNDKEFAQTFFTQVSTAAALSLLAKFENDIRNIEKDIVTYCYYSSLPACNLHYESFQTIIALNSNCVKVGDEIEINAGVGSFSTASQPKFTIDGKLISSDENGIAAYKFKTPLKAGKYTKSVKIEYVKPDGTKESVTKNIEYTVIE